jgi:hypothetical protein
MLPGDQSLVVIPDIHTAVARAKASVERWPRSGERAIALRWLELLPIGIDDGAPLLYKRGRTPLGADADERVLELLLGK